MIQTVLFDLDGTLIRTLTDVTDCMNKAFQKEGISLQIPEEVTKMGIGIDPQSMMKVALDYYHIPVSLEKLKKVTQTFCEEYKKDPLLHTLPFPYIEEVLQELKAKGIKLGVISNKLQNDASRCIQKHFSKDLFLFVQGDEQNGLLKPDAEVFNRLANKYHLEKETTLYVGDMKYDAEFAKNVGMDFAICNFGYGTTQDKESAKYLINDYRDLLKIVLG